MQTFKRQFLTLNPALFALQLSSKGIVMKSSKGWQIKRGSDLGGSGSPGEFNNTKK